MIGRALSWLLDLLLKAILLALFLSCGSSLERPPADCPPPDYVFSNAALLSQATEVSVPDGCECDAPLRPALTSSWPGGCQYTYEARCDACVVDVVWSSGAPPPSMIGGPDGLEGSPAR